MKNIIILSVLFFLMQPAFSQIQTLDVGSKERPYIEVTGHAEREVVPDEIYLQITIKEREEGREVLTIEMQEEQLKLALRELNIPVENLSVSDALADYIRVKWTKKDVVSQNEYELKLANAQQVGEVFEKLDELKVEDARISRVSHSKIEEFKKEVEIEAIKNAKKKADYLLGAIGEKTGKALIVRQISITNQLQYGRGVPAQYGEAGVDYRFNSSGKFNIEFKKLKIERDIFVKFEIE